MMNLAEPFSIVTLGGTRHQLSIAMLNVDFGNDGREFSEFVHVAWDEIDAVMKLVGDRPMLTAGTGLAALLKSSAMFFKVHDILDVDGDPSLAAMCQRMNVSLAQTRAPAIDAALAIGALAAALLSGRARA
jgi:hypothetical protein